MKRVFIICVIVFLVAVSLVLFFVRPSGRKWAPTTQMSFLGFTNLAAGAPATNALFGFNQMPSGSTSWECVEVSCWDGTNWILANLSSGRSFDWFQPGTYTTNYQMRGTVAVESVSKPTRVVVRLTRHPGRFREAVEEFLGPIAGKLKIGPVDPLGGPPDRYYMTNEFNLGDSTQGR